MRYSWKAITCCLSKGMLVTVAAASMLGAVGYGVTACEKSVVARKEQVRETCRDLLHRLHQAEPGSSEQAEIDRQYQVNCQTPEREPAPAWVAPAIGWSLGFAAALLMLFSICRNTISYCQVAVDTGRRPWYFLPKIGNPLPSRDTVEDECSHCHHVKMREETEDEYRQRLGLPPLGGANG